MHKTVQAHYDAFLAGRYSWISGSPEEQVRKNRDFFSTHGLTQDDNPVAIDLGAGCGFQSIPLAGAGYSVTAVDFCGSLLDELRSHAGDLPVTTVRSDIRHYSSWSGLYPGLIVCIGDSLTHLDSLQEAGDLVRQCYSELNPGGRLVLSLRDYSSLLAGTVDCIPVRRDDYRIFLCKVRYLETTVTVEDILYSRTGGSWRRDAGTYSKIRIPPEYLARIVLTAGFTLQFCEVRDGIITIIAMKGNNTVSGS
jgi:SAM-dependent methyltransferase